MFRALLFTGSFSPTERGRTTKMKCRDVSLAAVLLCMVLSALIATDAQAKKGGGGKPPAEPTPPGQVFFNYHEDGVSVGYAVDADGNNAVVGVSGTPSYELHGGSRWFLQWGESSGLGKEIFAVRDDNEVTVQLTNDPNLEKHDPGFPVWVPGSSDSEISFVGMDVNTKQSSVFKIGVDFDPNSGTPIQTAPSPVWPLPTVYWEPDSFGEPDAYRHSWSYDGNLLVYGGVSPEHAGIHVADLLAETETTVVTQGTRPSISPDGTTIAFSSGANLNVVNTDGSGEMVLVESKHQGDKDTWHLWPVWSPDSNYLIWQRSELNIRWNKSESDIWRIDRDGGNPVNLTPWVENDPRSNASNPWVFPTGWRVDGGDASGSVSTAIPEPASFVLLVMGSFALLGNRWRRHPAGRRGADQIRADKV
jgi:hypothetical protein